MNKKGFSTIELLVSFLIISFIAIAMFKTVLDLLDKVNYYQEASQMTVLNGNIINSVQKDLNHKKFYGANACGCNCYDITYQDLSVRRLKVDDVAGTVQYGGITEKLPDNVAIYGGLQLTKATFAESAGKNDTVLKIFIPIENVASGKSQNINIIFQYDSRDSGGLPAFVEKPLEEGLSCTLGVNKPVLAPGMTAVKWNSATSTWNAVANPNSDTTWYNYPGKEWANAMTSDGSMWVWIPRYVYKITSGWHSSTSGLVDIRFSLGTDDTRGGLLTIDETSSANASNGTWSSEPAFNWGNQKLAGIWVAKFEASSASGNVKVAPSVASWRSLNIDSAFTNIKNMENSSVYGWTNSIYNNGVNTHLIKNTEWGAALYLSASNYGKETSEIWNNPSSSYITGCSGTGAYTTSSTGCSYYYDSPNGEEASTTGNITGIYDMAGGSWEYTSAYVNNGNSSLNDYGRSVVNADGRYKNIYTVSSDSSANNYSDAINRKSDAIYETSSSSSSYNAWYSGLSQMPSGQNPFFGRGGNNTLRSAFSFTNLVGSNSEDVSFRPVVISVNEDPDLTITGNSSISVTRGDTYSDAGATAIDYEDGNLNSVISVSGTVNTNVVGDYSVTYTVTDSTGNSRSATRTVSVVE